MSALAWPVVVGGVLLAFRRELRRWLADRPASIKMGALAVEWERRSTQVAVGLAESGVPASVEPDPSGTAGLHLANIGGSSPTEAIRGALTKIENRLRSALTSVGVLVTEQETLPRLAQLAVENGLINSGGADSVTGVAVMANLALVKPDKVAERELAKFLALANGTLFAIDLAIRKVEPRSNGVVQPA